MSRVACLVVAAGVPAACEVPPHGRTARGASVDGTPAPAGVGVVAASPSGRGVAPAGPPDTGVVDAHGPVVVAAFPATRATRDAGGDADEARDDFQTSLPAVAAGLRARGVALAVRYAAPVRVRTGAGTLTWAVSPDSGGVGYLLVAPGRAPHGLGRADRRRPPRRGGPVLRDADGGRAFGAVMSVSGRGDR